MAITNICMRMRIVIFGGWSNSKKIPYSISLALSEKLDNRSYHHCERQGKSVFVNGLGSPQLFVPHSHPVCSHTPAYSCLVLNQKLCQ